MLTIKHAPKLLGDIAISDAEYGRARWQGALLTSLLQAQLFWKTAGSIWNGPLATFHKVLSFNSSGPRDTNIALSVANNWFSTTLPFHGSVEDRQNINVRDYDAFIAFQERYFKHAPNERCYDTGLLKLTHPVQPSADTLLDFFREAETNEARMRYILGMPQGRTRLVLRYVIHCLYRARRVIDVRWALDFHRIVMPKRRELVRQGTVKYNAWATKHERMAHPSEIASGIRVDVDGRLASFSFAETVEQAKERERKASSKVRWPLAQPTM